MLVEAEAVEKNFDRLAPRYARLYDPHRSNVRAFVDRMVFNEVYHSYSFAFNQTKPIKGKRVLDVGCGPGRYVIEAARRGAQQVIGVDLSGEMLKIAETHAEEQGVKERCKFFKTDFLKHQFSMHFDVTFAIGLLEYTENPTAILRKIFRLTGDQAIFTFMGARNRRAFLKRFNLFQEDCPTYNYDEERIIDLLGIAGFEILEMQQKGPLYMVSTRPRVRVKGAYR